MRMANNILSNGPEHTAPEADFSMLGGETDYAAHEADFSMFGGESMWSELCFGRDMGIGDTFMGGESDFDCSFE